MASQRINVSISIDEIMQTLSRAARDVESAQQDLDFARAAYQSQLTALSIEGLNAAVFPAKGDEAARRPAANDRERELAIDQTCGNNAAFTKLREHYERCQRVANFARDHQNNWRLIAQLAIAQPK